MSVKIADVMNTLTADELNEVAAKLLKLRDRIDEVPENERHLLAVQAGDFDSLFEILQPIHAKSKGADGTGVFIVKK